MKGFSITTQLNEMDLHAVHDFISRTYWAEGIPADTLQKALAHSLCFGVLTQDGKQVGFARAITDRATFAYLADVYVLEDYRGLGLSKWLMETVMEHPDLQGLRRMMLATRDAHGLYSKFGFEPVMDATPLMQKWRPGIYQQKDN